ncbi:hypothetical protein BGX38DRAFT_1208811 [Terfezia claveryi]|nr:hypothetical protein BGX38DRAFT_1208811 [Terfezia claveryi]
MSGTSTGSDTGSKPSAVNPGHEPLKERVEDLIQFIDSHKFCLMTTRQKNTDYLVSRCMAVVAREGIDLLFHTDTESGKTDELVGDPHVNIGFLKESTGDWASVSGTASIITDRELVTKYYSNQLRAWVGDLGDGVHDGGPNDPRVGVIKIHMKTATYCLSQGNAFTRGIEVAKGTITRKPAQVNKLRELTENELDMYRNLIS